MNFMDLTNLMDPRFKDTVILNNLGLHSTGIISLCRKKILLIDGLLSKGRGKTDDEADPIIRKDQSEFDRILMSCIAGDDETERVDTRNISFGLLYH
jgi:hypothetical protein